MAPRLGRPKVLDPAGEQAAYEHAQRRTRIIGRLVVGFFALIVLAGGIGGVAYQEIFSKVDYGKPLASVLPRASRPAPAAAKPNPTTGAAAPTGSAKNILILGVDSRLGENSQFQVKGAPAQTEDLSDTAILAHLSADGNSVTLVSIPRDSVVQIPSCEKVDNDGNPILTSSGQTQYSKPTKALFNQAIELGGPYCSAQTLESLTGVRIDNFLEIDFNGVVKMSKAIGGVPLNICEPIHDKNTGLNLPAGPVNLIGDQALAFVRARYGLTGGDDLHRIQRQQQFMASMVRKALSSHELLQPDHDVQLLLRGRQFAEHGHDEQPTAVARLEVPAHQHSEHHLHDSADVSGAEGRPVLRAPVLERGRSERAVLRHPRRHPGPRKQRYERRQHHTAALGDHSRSVERDVDRRARAAGSRSAHDRRLRRRLNRHGDQLSRSPRPQ